MSSNDLHFHNPEPLSKKEALEVFSTGTNAEICDALVAVALDESQHWQWVQEQCLKFLDHPERDIKRLAATCLGHVARIHGRLDRELVVNALRSRLKDEVFAGTIEDALEDIHIFLSVFKGFESLPIHHTAALSTFEEFLEDYEHAIDPEILEEMEEAEKRFSFTTTLKWDYDWVEFKMPWCWEVFGPKHGECELDNSCPDVLSKGKNNVKPHSHEGTWTTLWLGKTNYDFGYQKFFFKNKAMRDVFEREIRL